MSKPYISTMSRKTIPGKTMCHKQALRTLKKQSGSAIVIAIFAIIVISLLGASLMSLQRDSAQGTSYEVYAARAYLAAYSASEIALAQLFPLGSSASQATCAEINAMPQPDLPSDNAGFYGCSTTSACTVISSAVATRYKVLSTASCKNSQINTRRQITVEATNL